MGITPFYYCFRCNNIKSHVRPHKEILYVFRQSSNIMRENSRCVFARPRSWEAINLFTIMRSNQESPDNSTDFIKVPHSPLNHWASGMAKPCFLFNSSSLGSNSCANRRGRIFRSLPMTRNESGTFEKANSITRWSRKGARTSSEVEHARPIHLHKDVISQVGHKVSGSCLLCQRVA